MKGGHKIVVRPYLGAFNHAPQLRSYNYYLLVPDKKRKRVYTGTHVNTLKEYRGQLTHYYTHSVIIVIPQTSSPVTTNLSIYSAW